MIKALVNYFFIEVYFECSVNEANVIDKLNIGTKPKSDRGVKEEKLRFIANEEGDHRTIGDEESDHRTMTDGKAEHGSMGDRNGQCGSMGYENINPILLDDDFIFKNLFNVNVCSEDDDEEL